MAQTSAAPAEPSLRLTNPTRAPLSTTPGRAPQQTRQADFIVAVVNSEPITNHEVQLRVARLGQQLSRQGNAPSRKVLENQVLERLIIERAQLQVARAQNIKPDEAAIDNAVALVARQNEISVEELRRRLTADGISYARFREDLRDELTLTRLRDRELDQKIRVTELEIDQYLKNPESVLPDAPEEINLAQILIAVPETATPAQVAALEAKAKAAAERAKAKGADFSALAAELSDASDKRNGGELGLRPADRLPPLFVDASRGQSPGAVVGPVRSGAGFHVLKVVERKRAGMPETQVTQARTRHILLRTGPALTEGAAIARLTEFRRRIAAGQADFAQLAKDNSQDGSAKEGGDLGWASPGVFVPEFEQAINALKPGEISEPLVTRFGVHLVQLLERRSVEISPREQREVARNIVREKKMDDAYRTWVQDLRGRAFVEYREAPQ